MTNNEPMKENIFKVSNLTKEYPGVTAIDNVSVDIKKGTVHCIVGENGAGKSTFIKILTGAESRTSGSIIYDGKEYHPRSVRDAMNYGMSMLYQELNIVEYLTVEQNLNLGKENHKFGFIVSDIGNKSAIAILKEIDPTINIKSTVSNLSVAQKQIIEIVKAIATDAKVIVMDEPTAAITEEETKKLFEIIKDLKNKKDVTIIYISHRLAEIFEIGDFVTVFRDGKIVSTKAISEITEKTELIKMMIGKVVTETYIRGNIDQSKKILEVKELSDSKLKNVKFDLYKGEIVGFYGLIGSGKTEIAQSLFGIRKSESRNIFLEGKNIVTSTPRQAIDSGISMVPEERRTQGLFTNLSIRENIPVMNIKKVSRFGLFSRKKEKEIAKSYIDQVRIMTPTEEKLVAFLSGGNQQKVVIAKCLCAGSNIVLLDEPTRGVDVGAKEEIHNIIRDLAKQGAGIIVFSSELPEIVSLCDRIFVMFNGELKASFKNGPELDTDSILHFALGIGQ
ncbi:MAG: sugar ABC transporter ATP-binding protein [Candidatus Humimicrobiaceae bacterium]